MMRWYLPVLLVTTPLLSGCVWLTDQERSDHAKWESQNACGTIIYDTFKTNDPGGLNVRQTDHTFVPSPTAPLGCNIQAGKVESPGVGIELGKVAVGGAFIAGGMIGQGIALRPPQYNEPITLQNGTGSTFGGGVGGGAQFAPGSVKGGSAAANNGGMRFNASNTQGQYQGMRSVNTNTAQGGQGGNGYGGPPGFIPGGQQTFTGGGHTWNCTQGMGCVDP